jgi:hypothetical protein
MKCLALCAFVSLSWAAFGQNLQPSTNEKSLPDSASTSKVASENNSETPFVVRPVPTRPPTLRIEAGPPAERRHVADRGFLIVSLFQIGATIGDIESTQYGLGHGAKEANPLFGSHPSRATQYAIAMPIAAGVVAWSYRLKRSAPHSGRWLIPQIVAGVVHTGALCHNFMTAKTQ